MATPGAGGHGATNSTVDPAAAARRKFRDELNHKIAEEVWFAVAAFIFVLAFVRFADLGIIWYRKRRITARQKQLNGDRESAARPAMPTPSGPSLRRLPAALTSAFRIIAFRSTIPVFPGVSVTIAEASAALSYLAALLALLYTRASFGSDHPLVFYWQDRAAYIGSVQITLVVALAGKNNVVSWLTGISHEKLNVIHRAAGRILTVLFWIHGMVRIRSGLTRFGGFSAIWVRSGVMALAALTIFTLVGLRPIRKRFFEFFLITHIVTVILFIAGGYVHRPDVAYYFFPGFVVWAFDRLLRVARIVILNARWLHGSGNGKLSTGHLELAADNTVKMTLKRPMTWSAGQHAYIVMPGVSVFPFEAHPFTIASIPENVDGSATEGERELVFFVHGETGFTKRLRKHVGKNGHGSVTCLIDGPYGCPPDLLTFDTVILVAGGTGITYTFPLFLDVIRNAKLGKSSVQRIVFIWAIRSADDLNWISVPLADAIAQAPTHVVIEHRIFVTRGAAALPTVSYNAGELKNDSETSIPKDGESEKQRSRSSSNAQEYLSSARMEVGRPDIDSILKAEISGSPGQRVSVDVAGPGTLAAAVRGALRGGAAGPSSVLRGGASVSLHVETFSH